MTLLINNFEIEKNPFTHVLSEVDLPFTYNNLIDAISSENPINIKTVNNNNFQKTEIRISDSKGIIYDILSMMSSFELASQLSDIFEIKSLSPDVSFDGGGLTISEAGGYLRYHADFPYSNVANKYRVINCILYLSSPDIIGGDLHLLDPLTKTVEASIQPLWGRILAFPTSRSTPHGFSIIKKGRRIGVNAYFYADYPLDDRITPSKTEWL